MIELESVKTRISAPAHPSATDGRVSGLVFFGGGGGGIWCTVGRNVLVTRHAQNIFKNGVQVRKNLSSNSDFDNGNHEQSRRYLLGACF